MIENRGVFNNVFFKKACVFQMYNKKLLKPQKNTFSHGYPQNGPFG